MPNKHILLVHGQGPQPSEATLTSFWREALLAGLARDFPKATKRFEQTSLDTCYYADEQHNPSTHNAAVDEHDRRRALDTLTQLDKAKAFRRKYYDDLPGKSSRREFMMDVTASLGLSSLGFKKYAPQLHAYLNSTDPWATQLTARLANWLDDALAAHDRVLLISHCMGNVVAYNALWHLSHGVEQAEQRHVDTWLTLGSPLAANYVRNRLYGATADAQTRYPNNILAWHNISAEDDYMCHDMTVADDFKGMLTSRLTSEITDHPIYNLATRFGQSDPHHSAGYLIHPRTSELLKNWLMRD